jgi:hypothetical protein
MHDSERCQDLFDPKAVAVFKRSFLEMLIEPADSEVFTIQFVPVTVSAADTATLS